MPAWALGTVVGPLIGAVLTEKASWRWIFWMNVPIVVLGFGVITFFLNQTPVPGSVFSKLKRFDWLGAVILTTGLSSFLIGISWGGVQYPWDDWKTWFPIIEGVQLTLGITVYEFYFHKEPIIRKEVFNNKTMIICYITGVVHGTVLYCLIFYIVIYYEAVKLYSNISTALAVLPESLTIVRKY